MVRPPRAPSDARLSLKLTLAGDFQVGKTSLLRRFVSNTFDERYVTTLGAKVDSKTFVVADPRDPASRVEVGAQIWDVMGNPGFRELLKDAYFFNTKGLLLVCDATRPETVESLSRWNKAASSVAGDIPVVVLLNKADLTGESRVTPQDMDRACSAHGWTWLPTSAKTGNNVERAFEKVTELYLKALRKAGTTKKT
jgi:small GTP-binding protein